MSAIGIVLLVAFIIVCVLLVLLVVIQDNGENGMGGLMGGRGTAAFGSHSASVLTKATAVLVTLFFVLAIGLAIVNKKPKAKESLEATATEMQSTTQTSEEATATETTDSNWWESSEASAE